MNRVWIFSHVGHVNPDANNAIRDVAFSLESKKIKSGIALLRKSDDNTQAQSARSSPLANCWPQQKSNLEIFIMVATILTYHAFAQNSFLYFPTQLKPLVCLAQANLRAISFKSSQTMMGCGCEIAFGDGLGSGELRKAG